MGGVDFSQIALGKDMGDAYRRAVDEAYAYAGHQDGYNGTISTTDGFVSVDLTLSKFPAARRKIVASAALGISEYDRRFIEPPAKLREYGLRVWKDPLDGTEYVVPKALRPAERGTAVAIHMRLQKRGPAFGYEVRGKEATEIKRTLKAQGRKVYGLKVYRFFGIAAS